MANKVKEKNSKVRIADNGYRLPEQLPVGEILIDSLKNEWVLGKPIACGGFGEIYEARPSLKNNSVNQKRKDYEYVIKLDHSKGPLFCEMNFYIRAAKQEYITKWMSEKGLKFLGVPPYIASGTHNKEKAKTLKAKDSSKYRFLVMPKYGSDLQKILNENDHKLSLKTAYTIGIKVLDILEYIHSHGYIHADIKASNLLVSLDNKKDDVNNEIWLVDFGLVEKYLKGDNVTHKPFEEDLRRANNGTIEFTSRDAHIGCFSRRSDIEILAYNLLSWLSGGQLPWMSNLSDKVFVKNMKNNYMNRVNDLLEFAFKSEDKSETKKSKTSKKEVNNKKIPEGLAEFFKQVIQMKFSDKPNYKLLKNILEKAIIANKEKYDGTFNLSSNIDVKNKKVSPLKRKFDKTTSSSNNNGYNCSEVSVILDSEESSSEKVITKKVRKMPAKISSRKTNSVLNSKETLNGHKNIITNGKKNDNLLNENKINKQNSKDIENDKIIDLDDKKNRRNPSRKVKTVVKENLSNGPYKNGLNNKKLSKDSTKSENQIVYNGKVWNNPTPAMIELLDRLKNKN